MKHRSSWAFALVGMVGILIVAAIAAALMPGVGWQTDLLALTRHLIVVVVGEASGLIAYASLLLKLLYFGTLALLVWGVCFAKSFSRNATLLIGVASTVGMASLLEILQAILPYREGLATDGLWCMAFGGLAAVGLWICQWAADRFPKLINRETILYIVFGVVTTIVNILSFQICINWAGMEALVANTVAWVLSVLVAYTTNKIFVFESRTIGLIPFLREIGLFFAARLLSFGFDELGIWLMVDVAHIHSGLSKVATNIVVLILNYLFSKWFIFTKKENE